LKTHLATHRAVQDRGRLVAIEITTNGELARTTSNRGLALVASNANCSVVV
jgi:hypothetical protein